MTLLSPALAGRDRPAADAHELRTLASRLSSAASRYESAARRLSTRTAGLVDVWHGAAATAACRDLGSLRARAQHAADRHLEAAEVLLTCAGRLDEAQATWQRAEALERQDAMRRATATARGDFLGLLDDDPLRRQAARLADDACAETEQALRRAAASLRELAADAPEDAPRSLSALDHVRGFGRAAVDAVWGSVVTVAGLSSPRLLLDRDGWFAQLRELRDAASYTVDHPGEAGQAVVGWPLLREGRYGEWAGGLAPDLLGGVLSGGALPVVRRGVDVADDLTDVAANVAELQRVHGRSFDVNAGGPVQPRPGAELPDGYVDVIRDLTPQRRTHILDGDETGGGHRHGTGHHGKTEFPAHWSDDDIIQRVMETARAPEAGFWNSKHNTFNVTGTFDGVVVVVAVKADGSVKSAFPQPGGRGVVKNP